MSASPEGGDVYVSMEGFGWIKVSISLENKWALRSRERTQRQASVS